MTTPNTENHSGAAPQTDPQTPPVVEDKDKQAPDGEKKTEAEIAADAEQKRIDAIVQERVAREQKKQAELQKQNDELAAFKRQAEEEKAKLQAEKEEREKARLLEKGEFEKVIDIERKQHIDTVQKLKDEIAAEKRKNEEFQLKDRSRTIDEKLREASIDAKNAQHLALLLKADHTFTVDDNGHLVIDGDPTRSLKDLVSSFLANNPELAKGKYEGKTGSGSQTPPPAGSQTFTAAQIKDPAFYKANQAAIDLAAKEGRITQ